MRRRNGSMGRVGAPPPSQGILWQFCNQPSFSTFLIPYAFKWFAKTPSMKSLHQDSLTCTEENVAESKTLISSLWVQVNDKQTLQFRNPIWAALMVECFHLWLDQLLLLLISASRTVPEVMLLQFVLCVKLLSTKFTIVHKSSWIVNGFYMTHPVTLLPPDGLFADGALELLDFNLLQVVGEVKFLSLCSCLQCSQILHIASI